MASAIQLRHPSTVFVHRNNLSFLVALLSGLCITSELPVRTKPPVRRTLRVR